MENTCETGYRAFLKRKDIVFTAERYLERALSAMALGLFASLLTGLILKTLGEEIIKVAGEKTFCLFLVEAGTMAQKSMGAAMGCAIAWGLFAPPLVMFSSAVTGMAGAAAGGPAGAFVAACFGAEFGKAISKETRVDILATPVTTIVMGCLAGVFIGPVVGGLMEGLGKLIMVATTWHPFVFGSVVAVLVGLALTAPISSAALCMMLNLSGLAAGAATAGCCAQMVGFAVISRRDNDMGDFVAQSLGTSMLQISNIVRNPWILLPPTLAGAVCGPVSTVIFQMKNSPIGAGMGTSGLVGQIGTFTEMGMSGQVLLQVLLVHILLPALVALLADRILREKGKIHKGDMNLHRIPSL